ncbi:PadR family transcriptional regulator [Actinomyces oricola]|uniref:PadR family transcriptional regulator n=1 Tax=Actinomyces oricola TaxID=206043 RepID=UPI000FFE72A1|nr:PadR family transcriptional regulator [Actinomyces oricola]
MLDLQILGLLDDGPLHGYELRRRITALSGPGSHVSEGSLYPALARMERAGLLTRHDEPGARGRARRVVRITEAGRQRLHQLLRGAQGADIESMPRFMNVLAFLSHLPQAHEREAVLRRRLKVLLSPPPAFFYDDGAPRRGRDEPDPYRRGMTCVAAAARRAEIAWLRETLDHEPTPPQPPALQGTPPDTPARTGCSQPQEPL